MLFDALSEYRYQDLVIKVDSTFPLQYVCMLYLPNCLMLSQHSFTYGKDFQLLGYIAEIDFVQLLYLVIVSYLTY